MPRYMIERSFPDGLEIPVASGGAQVCQTGVCVAGIPFPAWLIGPLCGAAGLATLGLELGARQSPAKRLTRKRLLLEAAGVVALLSCPSLLHRWEFVLAFALFAVLGLRLIRAEGSARGAATVAVAIDFAVEALLGNGGLYLYPEATLAPLPIWLPALWANLGVSAWRLYGCLPAPVPKPRPNGVPPS